MSENKNSDTITESDEKENQKYDFIDELMKNNFEFIYEEMEKNG